MTLNNILLIMILIVSTLLLLSIVAYGACSLYYDKHKDEPPTKEDWKLM